MNMKNLLYDLMHYEMMTTDEQKCVRETYNLTTTQVQKLIDEVII